jgi:hypothetical protein
VFMIDHLMIGPPWIGGEADGATQRGRAAGT